MEEVWLDVFGYKGLYKVSTLGRVWSYRRKIFLKGSKNSRGYISVTLCKNNTTKMYRLNRLVALHFIKNIHNKKEVNHINEIKDDNRLVNLEWMTRKENCNHGTRNERISSSHGMKPFIVYNKKDMSIVGEWGIIERCGEDLDLDRSHISHCLKKIRKSHNGYVFKFKE